MPLTAASQSQTNFQAMLKELYPGKEPEYVATRKFPLLAKLKKADDFTGDNFVQPLLYEYGGGMSANFANAQSYRGPSKSVKFVGSQKTRHVVGTIDALTIRSSRDKRGAFVTARKKEVDGYLRHLGRKAALDLYGDGMGSIGAASSVSTTTVTLTRPEDSIGFYIGQVVIASANADGSSPRDSGAGHEVSAVDEDAGTVTFTDDVDADGFAASDYLFAIGDNDGSGSELALSGLAGWLPLTAPTGGDSWLGVDRSVMPRRLAGARLNNTANSISENLLELSEKIVMNGGAPDCAYINHVNFTSLVKELDTKKEYDDETKAGIGFSHVTVHTSAGDVKVYPDPACPTNRGYLLQQNCWTLHHLDGFPHIDMLDGNAGLRQSAADGIEIRCRYWAELFCDAPGFNGVFAI